MPLRNQEEPATTSVEDRHLPSLYQSADRASLSAQRRYISLHLWHLICLILGSVGVALVTIFPNVVTWTYITLAIVLVIGVLLTLVSRVRRDDDVWF